jgi:hypothetical protein
MADLDSEAHRELIASGQKVDRRPNTVLRAL